MSLRMSILILNMQYRLYIDFLCNDSQLYSRFFRAFSVLDLLRKIVILRNKTPCFLSGIHLIFAIVSCYPLIF